MNPASNNISLALLLALAACVVTLPDEPGDETSATAPSGATATSDPTTTSDPAATSGTTTSEPTTTSTAADTTTGAGEVPPELAGRSWTWVTGSGAHTLFFAPEGEYASAVFLDAHPGDACGIEYFTHRAGVAVFVGSTLTLSPDLSRRTKFDSCSDQVLSEEVLDDEVSTHEWRIVHEDGCPEALVLTGGDGIETSYCADA